MDIHNIAKTPWTDMDPATKAEIERQEAGGAVVDELGRNGLGWRETYVPAKGRCHGAYRIRPSTEIPPLPSVSTRPADELDLTKLTRICGEWHPETRAAMLPKMSTT